MRIVRIPYKYLSYYDLKKLRQTCARYLYIISDIHKGIPNKDSTIKQLPQYIYHADYLKWAYWRATQESYRRGIRLKYGKLFSKAGGLRSRPLSEMIPPKEEQIAGDVAALCERWSLFLRKGGEKLPVSYVHMAMRYYDGFDPEERYNERIDFVSGRNYHDDAGWYNLQGEEEAFFQKR